MKYNRSEIFKNAWKMVREIAITISEALKKAWAQAKAAAEKKIRYAVKDWFFKKNYDKLSTAHLEIVPYFNAEDILQETEKALKINFEMWTKNLHADSIYNKIAWIPKSCVEAYEI